MTDEDDDLPAAAPALRNRMIAIVLCFVAAGALLVAALSHRWLAHPVATENSAGLLSMQICQGPTCVSKSNSDVVEELRSDDDADRWVGERPDPPSRWFGRLGVTTFVLAVAAILALLASAGIALANKRPELPVAPTTIALVALILAIPTACLFAATKPEAIPLGVSWSFWLFGGGDVVGLLAALLVSRQLRPADPDLLADAMNPDDFE
jgi:hypothetical protein